MSDLDTTLQHIIDSCAPTRNNNCLHKELQGLSALDMSTVAARYIKYVTTNPAAKDLPVLSLDDMLSPKAMEALENPRATGDVSLYNFRARD